MIGKEKIIIILHCKLHIFQYKKSIVLNLEKRKFNFFHYRNENNNKTQLKIISLPALHRSRIHCINSSILIIYLLFINPLKFSILKKKLLSMAHKYILKKNDFLLVGNRFAYIPSILESHMSVLYR
jgi:hypothetical protein